MDLRRSEKMVKAPPPLASDPAIVSLLLTMPHQVIEDIRLLVRILRAAPITERLNDGFDRKTAFIRQFLDLLRRN